MMAWPQRLTLIKIVPYLDEKWYLAIFRTRFRDTGMFLSIRFIKRFLGFIQSWAQIALAQNAQNIIFARNFFKCRYLDICVVFICSNSRSYHRDQISKIQNIEEVVHLSISVLNQSRFSDHQHSKQVKSEISGLLVSCNINTQSIGVSTVYLWWRSSEGLLYWIRIST